MATEIKVPDLGVNVDSVVFLRWLINEGEAVKRGDPLCEVETDKATTEIESIAQGTLLKQMAQPDEEIKTGTVIAYIGEAGETIT